MYVFCLISHLLILIFSLRWRKQVGEQQLLVWTQHGHHVERNMTQVFLRQHMSHTVIQHEQGFEKLCTEKNDDINVEAEIKSSL